MRARTHAHTFSAKRIFRLREHRNVENHRNLGVEKFHRYQAFSLRKQKSIEMPFVKSRAWVHNTINVLNSVIRNFNNIVFAIKIFLSSLK